MNTYVLSESFKTFSRATIYMAAVSSVVGLVVSAGLVESTVDDTWRFFAWFGILIFTLMIVMITIFLYFTWKKYPSEFLQKYLKR
jgi:hypothetical protein